MAGKKARSPFRLILTKNEAIDACGGPTFFELLRQKFPDEFTPVVTSANKEGYDVAAMKNAISAARINNASK